MANFSNTLEGQVLNHFFRNTPTTAPTTHFMALFLNNPTDAGTGTEVSGTGYVRQPITFGAPAQIDGKGTIKNSAEVEFPQAGSNWGTVTHGAIYTASTGGTMLVWAPLNNPKIIETDDILKVLVDEFVVTLD